jgi:hypothetical protein
MLANTFQIRHNNYYRLINASVETDILVGQRSCFEYRHHSDMHSVGIQSTSEPVSFAYFLVYKIRYLISRTEENNGNSIS